MMPQSQFSLQRPVRERPVPVLAYVARLCTPPQFSLQQYLYERLPVTFYSAGLYWNSGTGSRWHRHVQDRKQGRSQEII